MKRSLDIDVTIDHDLWKKIGFKADATARKAIEAALVSADLPQIIRKKTSFEISVLLTGDTQIRALNRDFRKKDKPTNVLSFASLDASDSKMAASLPGPFHLGDIVLALDTLEREALEQDKSLKDHFIHLTVHGTLHLLGYDHMQPEEAKVMESLEVAVLKSLGIENPYNSPGFMPE